MREEAAAVPPDRRYQTGIHYPVPIYRQPVYASLGPKRGDFPLAELLAHGKLFLYPELTEKQIDLITRLIQRFFDGSGRP
jgi:dTDP-4-amino-4,6-dideoxygalactose transaminase